MPEYIAQTNMDTEAVAKLKEEMTLLTRWIARNHTRLFINESEEPSSEYVANAKE